MKRPHLSNRQRLLARIAFFAVIILLFAIALRGRWRDMDTSLERMSWYDMVLAFVLGFANIFTAMMAWRSLLTDVGSKLPIPVAMRIFYLGQLGKYLPGSVWTIVAQADLGRDHEVPPRRTVAVSVVSMGVSLAAGLVLAAFTLPFAAPGAVVHYAWVLLVLPVLVVGLLPKNVDRLTHLLLRMLRREPPDHEFTWRGVLIAFAWQAIGWGIIGLQVFVLCWAQHATIARTLPLALGGTALAWSAGFIAIPVPAGAGVREVILIAVLHPVLSVPAATLVALASRVVATVGDGFWAAVAVLLARHRGIRPVDLARKAREHPEVLPAEASHSPRVTP